jgi:signal transduction histidine kinase
VITAVVPQAEAVRVEVRDPGAGIAPEDHPRLFQRFSQLDGGKAGGIGLGLSIAKGIVEAHGGAIGVTSAPGAGSTFWFTLPVTPPR